MASDEWPFVKDALGKRVARRGGSAHTPVVTGSMRNGMRAREIEAPRDASYGGSEARRGSVGVPHRRVFCKKRLQAIENKGRVSEKENEEAASD